MTESAASFARPGATAGNHPAHANVAGPWSLGWGARSRWPGRALAGSSLACRSSPWWARRARWLARPGADRRVVLDALTLSLATTAISLVITVALGLPLAVVLARRHFRGSGLIEALVDLPIVLPPSVAGLALLLVLGRRGLSRRDRWMPLGSRSRSRRLPSSSRRSSSRHRSSSARRGPGSRAWTATSRTPAASTARPSARSVRYGHRPLAGPRLAAGLVMSWARAFGEFGATIMFAGNIEGRTQTLPLLVYGEFQAGTSTRRSQAPRSSCWRHSVSCSPSASSTGDACSTSAASPSDAGAHQGRI